MSTIFLIIVLTISCARGHYAKDSICQLADGTNGTCASFFNCPTAMQNLYENDESPIVCDPSYMDFRVCCSMQRVEKCHNYAEYVHTTIGHEHIKTNRCHFDSFYSALLGYRNGSQIVWQCGGSLVSTRYVLTAGHCTVNSEFGEVAKVRLGDLKILSTEDNVRAEEFDVEAIIEHPQYSKLNKNNDIALVKLSSQVTLHWYRRPICLPHYDIQFEHYIATGGGWKSPDGNEQLSNTLQKVKLEQLDYENCAMMGMQNITQLCAGYKSETNRTLCSGHMGNPLQMNHRRETCSIIQVGITTSELACERNMNSTAVYTKVFHYADWIESIIWANGEDF